MSWMSWKETGLRNEKQAGLFHLKSKVLIAAVQLMLSWMDGVTIKLYSGFSRKSKKVC